MKVAIFSESAADEAAIRLLINAVLCEETESTPLTRFEARRGWPQLLGEVPGILRYLYYQTDADALVIVADSNGAALHVGEHDEPDQAQEKCRLCALRQTIAGVRRRLRPVPARTAFRTACGLASPAIEAWYQCGIDPHATEAAWARDLAGGTQAPQYVRTLKRAVYGTDRPSLALEIECATQAARRLAENLTELERHFPGGFGALAKDVRSWRATQ